MDRQHPQKTQAWSRRNAEYRRGVLIAVGLSVAVHVLLSLALAPFRDRIPVVRHIGYYGPTRILPEISIERATANLESRVRPTIGRGATNAFHIVPITITDWAVPSDEADEAESNDVADDASAGDNLLAELEMSLPQPQSRDMVVLHLVTPEYPVSSTTAGVEGVVVFRLHVTKTGEVVNAWLLRSEVDRACERAALRALRRWRYRPCIVDGEPVSFLGDQAVRFRLLDPFEDGAAESRADVPGRR